MGEQQQAFEVGTVVQVRSGGPLMTVAGHEDKGMVRCIWFGADGEPRKERFAGVLLRRGRAPHPAGT